MQLVLLPVVAHRADIRATSIRQIIGIGLLRVNIGLLWTRYMSICVIGVDCYGPTLFSPGRAFDNNLGIDLPGACCT